VKSRIGHLRYTFCFFRKVRMPWKESSVMDERLRFAARLLDVEPMTQLQPGLRHFPQNWIEDLRPVQRARTWGARRSVATGGEARQSVVDPCAMVQISGFLG
jgi:hypothetical protein